MCFQGKTYKCGFHPSLFSSMSAKFGCSLVPYDRNFYVLSKVYHCYMQEDLSDISFCHYQDQNSKLGSLMCGSPWSCEESDMTVRLSLHFPSDAETAAAIVWLSDINSLFTGKDSDSGKD